MTATYPARQQVRECRLYRFYVTHPATDEVVLGYVGETGRQPFERLLEHLATQPWFDTVVRWEVDPVVYYGKTAVLRAETAAIAAERPLYNVKGNEQNPYRVIPPDAIRQRRARDAAAGASRWVHPEDRGTPARNPVRRSSPAVSQRPALSAVVRALLCWLAAEVATTLAGWAVFTHQHWGTGAQPRTAAMGVLPAAVAVFLLILGKTARKRTRRRVHRRMVGLGR